jgi:CheY-like chemotaxis protein
MVVDDEPDMRLAVRLILERHGHTVEEAASGEDACQRVQGAPPDLLLMDVRMPGQDGLETLGKIRETNKTMPVIIMTGYGNPETEREAFRKGANQYILKPFRNEDLMEAMSEVGLVDVEDNPAPRQTSLTGRISIPRSPILDKCLAALNHVLNVLRQAKAIFLDRWRNPPILFERDPSFEERISLRLSLITDPLKVIFFGLFDKDFEMTLEERAAEMNQFRETVEEPPSSPSVPVRSIPFQDSKSEPFVPLPAAVKPDVERVHQDLSLQINSVAQSLQAQIGMLAQQMQQQKDTPKTAETLRAQSGTQESPQEEFHRLLIELQASWVQGLTTVEKELAVNEDFLSEWKKSLPELRQAVDRSDIAPAA